MKTTARPSLSLAFPALVAASLLWTSLACGTNRVTGENAPLDGNASGGSSGASVSDADGGFTPDGGSTGPVPTMDFNITGLRTDTGLVYCALFASADGFPSDPTKAVATQKTSASQGRALCSFQRLPAGDYALSYFQDENGNGKLDTFLGVPQEGIGASNDDTPTFDPPKWEDAMFKYAGGLFTETLATKYFPHL